MVNTLSSELRGFPLFNAEPLSSKIDDNKDKKEDSKKADNEAVAVDSR
jgi:hypothetical protein